MASQQQTRIQAYLEKNKIGTLFEELMTKLITETPDHPIPFLIDHLQSKQGTRGQLQRTLSGSAALWAESEASENKGTRRDCRNYNKPWKSNAKKPKKSKSDLAVSSISPPSSDSKSLPRSSGHLKCEWKSKSEHHDFDELNHILQESKKLGKALENLSRSIAVSDELDKEAAALNAPVLQPRVVGEWVGREENDADPLADEMLQPPVPRSKVEQWDSEDSSSPGGSLKMKPKTKGLKHQQQQHKKLLAAMLSQDSFDSLLSPAPSVTEDDIDNEDDAMELLEDLHDLRMEGVTSAASTGSKFNQTRSSHTVEPQAKVTLNICARCARLQGDTLTEKAEGAFVVSESLNQETLESGVSLPGTEISMESTDELGKVSQAIELNQLSWVPDIKDSRSIGSSSRKTLKDSLVAKELQKVDKHLSDADIAKDLELWEEERNATGERTNVVALDHQGNIKVTLSQDSGLVQIGKDIQLQLQKAKSPLSTHLSLQVSNAANSSFPSSNTNTNKFSGLPTPSNRSAIPNIFLRRSVSPNSQGNKEGIISMQRSQSLISTNQLGRTITTPAGLFKTTGDAMGYITQRSSLSEDEFLQLQFAHQPWILPTDTESEGTEVDQDKRF